MKPKYPEGLPLPLRDGYGFDTTNNIDRTEMDSGRAKQRINFKNVPDMVNVSWLFTPPQARLFRAWVSDVAGAGWLSMRLLTDMSFDDLEVRFTSRPFSRQLVGIDSWRFSTVMEVRNPPMLAPGWAEVLPQYVLYSDIFDIIINREKPHV